MSPKKGMHSLYPHVLPRAIDGSAPQLLPVSLSKAVQKYGYLLNQQKQNNYQKETITTNKKDLSINDKVLYIFNISVMRKMAAKMEKSRTAKQKLTQRNPPAECQRVTTKTIQKLKTAYMAAIVWLPSGVSQSPRS